MRNTQQRFEGDTKKPGLGSVGKGLTVAALILWIGIFLAGIIINSAPYREQMTPGEPAVLAWFVNWIIVLFVYTPNNVAMLSIFAGLLGALGRCATLHVIAQGKDEKFPEDPIHPYLLGIVRGFIVYLLITSGMIVILESPPISPTAPDQYVQLACVISVASFIVSYNPRYFGKLLHRAVESLVKKKKTAQG